MLRGFAAKLVLDRLAGEDELPADRRRPRAKTGGRRRPPRTGGATRTTTVPTVRRGPLFGLMLACAGIGVPLMIIFEAPITRIVGVLALFGFIVAGVFVIADPAFLAGEEEGA
ncbi:MAG TPA: hypothetical protein VF533_09930 [Solirubrobacteraceae bacterium]|jgi:hypothetical protein